jgi:hypothetical protein
MSILLCHDLLSECSFFRKQMKREKSRGIEELERMKIKGVFMSKKVC